MELEFLGCGSAFNPSLGNTSAYFTKGEQLFIMDIGESVFVKLFERGLLNQYDQVFAIITHTHADHVGSLPSLISYCYYVLNKKIFVVHPEDSVVELLDCMGIDRNAYCSVINDKVVLDRVTFEAVPVEHVEDLKCFGYIITMDGKNIYYSGDASDIPDCVLEKFLSNKIEKIYQDTTEFMPEGHRSHCPLEVLETKIPQNLRYNVYCMHFTTEFYDKLTKKGFRYVLKS